MKKYMIMALMPFVFQIYLHAESKFADIDQRLAKEYENACQSINSNVRPHFEAVLDALEHDAKKGGNKRIVALGHIVAMQKLLQAYRAEEIQKLSYSSCGLWDQNQRLSLKKSIQL